MKKITLFLCLLSLLIGVNTIASTEYTGVVTPLLVTEVRVGTDAPYWGSVRKIAKLGEIVLPPIVDLNSGKTIKEGSLLASLNQQFFTLQMDAAKSVMEANKKMLNDSIYNYKRYKYLMIPWTGAASEHVYETYISTLSATYDAYINSVTSYIESKEFLKSTYQIASFEGIVNKIIFSQGLASQVATSVEVTMLNPIGVSIKLDRNVAREIGIDTPVKIIPIRGKAKPQGIFYGYSMLTPDGITFMTRNPIIKNNNVNNYPVVNSVNQVVYFDQSTYKNILAVPKSSIVNDGENGDFVYVAVGQTEMNVDKGIDNTFKVNKVKIETKDLFKLRDGHTRLQALDGVGNLKIGDLVIDKPDKNLKNGETVYFSNTRYTFMPGDKVQVFVGK